MRNLRSTMLLGCLGTLLVFRVPAVAADSGALVSIGTLWHYFIATNPPPADWYQTNFDDTAWLEKPSGFSSGQSSPYIEATLWPLANSYRSAFVRTRFQVEDATSIRWLILRVDYDDGFVAYLNGQEIVRRGLANNPVGWNDIPDLHPGGTTNTQEIDVTSAVGLLHDGENVLAIQVHNNPSTPNFSLRLVPELLGNFNRGPYIQNLTTNSVQMIWRTPVLADTVVDYGTSETLGLQATNSALVTDHVMTLTGLLPGTRYWYRIRGSSSDTTVISALASFRTFAASGPVVFQVLGDGGDEVLESPSRPFVPQYRIAQLMAARPADFVLHVGDIIYPYFYPGLEDARLLSVHREQLRSLPFFPTMGNHEFDPVTVGQNYLNTFFLPTNSATGTEHYYSFDAGDAHFVSLFVPQLNWGGFGGALPQYALTNGSVQYSWLTNDLARSAKPWKIIFFHVPINGSGSHRIDDWNGNCINDPVDLQNLLYPVASQYGVQLILNGHDHTYERFNPTNGIYSVVSGGGGSTLPAFFYPREADCCSSSWKATSTHKRDAGSCQFHLTWQFLNVSINGDTLRLEAIGTNGLVFDTMTIQRAPPPAPALHQATWNTPLVEVASANDGFGNISNQTFNLTGTPLLTANGKFSNLGRVFVNNDATNLYIGFEQAMIFEDNNLFLFVESPRLLGVSDLVGLGDGVIDSAQGVRGLDFLENLSFTNFRPSVAVLLGDEYGDDNDPLFSRPDLTLTNVGQGVFLLNASFDPAGAARVQQFNRSPQQLERLGKALGNSVDINETVLVSERNANFIEVVIPLSELGGAQPGDIIKLAAVVGGPTFDAGLQTRQLDTSFLGASFSVGGLSNAVSALAGINVRLALDPTAPHVVTSGGTNIFVPFNPQTGLYEQTVNVTNIGGITIETIKLLVGDFAHTNGTPRTNVWLWNAAGTNYADIPPRAYVEYTQPLSPGSNVTFNLVFYTPERRPFTNSLEALLTTASGAAVAGAASHLSIDRCFTDTRDGQDCFVMEWDSIPGASYTVVYSSNLVDWHVAPPSVTATATRTQWCDDGPPKTASRPFGVSPRYYRVIKN